MQMSKRVEQRLQQLDVCRRFPSKSGRHGQTKGALGATAAETKEEDPSALRQQGEVGGNAGGG